MNTKNNKLKQSSKSKIGTAFMTLMETNTVKDITVSDICKTANVNRSTFYANFIDIYDLIDKIGGKAFADFQELHKDDSESDYLLKLLHYIKDNQLFYKTYAKLRINNYFQHIDFRAYTTDSNSIYDEYHKAFLRAGVSKLINLWLERDCDISPDELYDIIKFH